MARLKVGAIFILLLLFSPPGEGRAAPIQGNIDDIAKVVLSYFPKMTGKVTSVEGDRLRIDVGGEKGLSEGALLTVYRLKEPFFHPVTGAPLGRYEETVAMVEVAQTESNDIVGQVVHADEKVLAGDLARLSAARIPVAVSMASEGPNFLMTELASALSETGRFKIDSLSPNATPEEALKRHDLYLIQVSTARSGEKFLMNLKIQNTQSGKLLSSIEAEINASPESDLILEHLQYQLFEKRQNKSQ
jgi:hypothetical protein